MTMKMRLKIKNRSHRYDINTPRPKHGHKYTQYKMCLIIVMVIGNKQHLSNIWGSFHKNVKQHWDWVEKKRCLQKKPCIWWQIKLLDWQLNGELEEPNCLDWKFCSFQGFFWNRLNVIRSSIGVKYPNSFNSF